MSREEELELTRRRERALMRSAELRGSLAQQARVLEAPLAAADKARAAARWLLQHPEWPVGVLVALVVVRPRRAVRWAFRLWWGWAAWQRGQRILARWSQPGTST
jgi:hypothetical protein